MHARIEFDFRTAADELWPGGTKDRLVSRSSVETSERTERMVRAAVVRAKAGDPEAVRFLYLSYADNVYSYVRTIVRHHHDAEDVTQQVFAKLLTTIHKYEPRQVAFVGWLLRMAHNVAIDVLRSQRAKPAEEIYGADERIDEDAPERARCLRDAIDALPEDQRMVVVLRHVLGMTPEEIAVELGRTPSSVHGLHHRGRRALRQELVGMQAGPTARQAVAA